MKCLYGLLLILIVLYIIGNVLKDVLYKDVPENRRKRFLIKWSLINLGVVAAIIFQGLRQVMVLGRFRESKVSTQKRRGVF